MNIAHHPKLSIKIHHEIEPNSSHFAATVYLLNQEHSEVFLIHHIGLGSYMGPGGHLAEGELPQDAALREVFEETGIEGISLLPITLGELNIESSGRHLVQFESSTVSQIDERIMEPAAIVEEGIPAGKKGPTHFHFDCNYIAVVPDKFRGEVKLSNREVKDPVWVPLVKENISELNTFPGVKAILMKLAELRESSSL